MGDHASLGLFAAEDYFLRRIAKPRYIKDDESVSWEAFDDKQPTLSFTFQDNNLKTKDGLDEYQRYWAYPSGDLLGLCKLSFYDLTVSLEPPLPPRHDPVPEDEKYGHLHCCTDPPRDQDHCEKMAKLAMRNGVVRQFVKARRR